ncbi:MAG: hypothetical protein KBT89_15710 [Gammaproteobacteria bacterium]|nr:hypothetical protein [Gammaproteobacteria bacterium]
MNLSFLIQEGGLRRLMTATPATYATARRSKKATVAKVAGVAVTIPPDVVLPIPKSKLLFTKDEDDRRYCTQCTNLMPSGLCLAANNMKLKTSRSYHPVTNILKRCEGYNPDPSGDDG